MSTDTPDKGRAPQRERVRELLATGHTPREIARLLDLSTQRVYQLMKALRESAA